MSGRDDVEARLVGRPVAGEQAALERELDVVDMLVGRRHEVGQLTPAQESGLRAERVVAGVERVVDGVDDRRACRPERGTDSETGKRSTAGRYGGRDEG